MFQHFGQRLKRDLKQLVDRRLDKSAVLSGSSVKVCTSLQDLRCQANGISRVSLPELKSMSSPTSDSDTQSGLVAPFLHHW